MLNDRLWQDVFGNMSNIALISSGLRFLLHAMLTACEVITGNIVVVDDRL